VVAFASDAGLLQFVPNTESLASYLYESPGGGAHGRYREEGEHTHAEVSAMVRSAPARSTPAQLLATFQRACKQLRPVFHRFFAERYRSSALWCG